MASAVLLEIFASADSVRNIRVVARVRERKMVNAKSDRRKVLTFIHIAPFNNYRQKRDTMEPMDEICSLIGVDLHNGPHINQ
jgi:hypothetical protein